MVSFNTLLLGILISMSLAIFTSAKVYVVYMGTSTDSDDPNEILLQNHRILSSVHSGSIQEAEASHLYSYKHGFKGFAAKLTADQAFQIAKMEGVVSVFENKRRRLHTTHSWDFIGLAEKETMEIPGFSTKDQVNVIIGFIDTGGMLITLSTLIMYVNSSGVLVLKPPERSPNYGADFLQILTKK